MPFLALLDYSNIPSNTLAMTSQYWIDASFCSDIETGLNLGGVSPPKHLSCPPSQTLGKDSIDLL